MNSNSNYYLLPLRRAKRWQRRNQQRGITLGPGALSRNVTISSAILLTTRNRSKYATTIPNTVRAESAEAIR